MNRQRLHEQLRAHRPVDQQEAACHRRLLEVLPTPGEVFSKHFFDPGHFTASAFVVSPDSRSLLLIHHAHFDLWIQPGGHLDPEDPDLLAAARRELWEETGLQSVTRPVWAPGILDLDVHNVPGGMKGQPAHQHYDVRFAFIAETLRVQAATDAKAVRWFPLTELHTVDTDDSVRRAASRILMRQQSSGSNETK